MVKEEGCVEMREWVRVKMGFCKWEKSGFCKAIGIFMVVASRIRAWWGRVGGRVNATRKEIPLRCHLRPTPCAVALHGGFTLLRLVMASYCFHYLFGMLFEVIESH